MSDDKNNTHHREQARAGVYSRAHDIARQNYTALTESQCAALANKIADHPAFTTFLSDGSLDPGDAWVKAEIAGWETTQAALFRTVPTPSELTAALVAKLPAGALPAEKVNLVRRVERMSADERLAASEGIDMSARAPEPKATQKQAALTDEQRARGWTAEDAELARRGVDVNKLLPLKRAEMRRAVADNAPATPAIAECKAKIATGKAFAQIDVTTRMRAAREAQAAGTTLKELGVS